jgi:hypothetical protein
MPDFLDHWVARPDDQAGKNWVAKALVDAFPEPWISNEFTHARAALAPIHDQLLLRADRCKGQVLDPQGWKREQPLLALAATVANKGFVRTGGRDGRTLLFRVIVELIAYNPGHAGLRGLKEYAHALRIELEALDKNPHARPPNPDFATALDVIPWFGQQLKRYPDLATTAWRRELSALLRQALLDPAPPPGITSDDDEDVGGDVVAMAPSWTDTELEDDEGGSGVPPSYWLVSEDDFGPRAGWDEGVRSEVLGASLSTYIPLGRFTEASPTYLTDEKASAEAGLLMAEAEGARIAEDRDTQRQVVAKALSLATATPIKHLALLRWGDLGPETPRQFPGRLSLCARWLFRPELAPKESKIVRDRWVHVPIPASLGLELLALGSPPRSGDLVFPVGKTPLEGSDRNRNSARATPTQLTRAAVCRLVTNKRWGPSAAQYVAGDDLGIDVAPLHYDRIDAGDLAVGVSAITSPWFGEPPGSIGGQLPRHLVGSRRIPGVSAIRDALQSFRNEWDASPKTLACRIRHRTRNLVHGLCLITGHRPNDNFGELTRRDIGDDDQLAILSDKPAGPDWAHRPVALEKRWVEEYRALLGDLASALDQHAATELGKASNAALEGSGPIFLAVQSLEDVRPFGLPDYQAGLPLELQDPSNFARQFLNDELSKSLPEVLRVAQLGWHGTRAGAFSDGSPWSVMTACARISPILDRVLKSVGWRPLERAGRSEPPLLPPISWRALEQENEARFKRRLSQCKESAATRRAEAVVAMRGRLAALLESGDPGVSIGLRLDGERLELAPGREGPVDVTPSWGQDIIRRLSGGDPRSLEAHAARGWLRDLVVAGRQREILTGAIPRKSHERWPGTAGSFLPQSPSALSAARQLDDLVCKSEASRALKVLVTLLLHGGYADLSAVTSALAPAVRLSGLASLPNVVLVEPADPSSTPDEPDEGVLPAWRHGTLAFDGLAGVALHYWHKSAPEHLDLEAVDAELGTLAAGHLVCGGAKAGPLPWLHELEALARIINSLRMDGVARLVGTGQVVPASAPIERVVALRDDLPMGPRSSVRAADVPSFESEAGKERTHRVHGLVDQVTAAIGEAVQTYKANRKKGSGIRTRLEKRLREWIGVATDYRPEELVALYALLLLTRGGKRRKKLELVTIQGYVYSVARPLMEALPSDPMGSDSDDWTQAFLAAVALAEPKQRPDRADALANFHWVLSQAMPVPDVDFGEVFAFAGRASYLADAGFLTKAELQGLAYVLGDAVETAQDLEGSRHAIHVARNRELVAQVAYSGALRPGEAICLSFRNLPRLGDGRLAISKNKFQGLKNINARRCPRLLPDGFGVTAADLAEAAQPLRVALGSQFSQAMPLFHQIDSPDQRIKDRELFGDLSKLIKWATGELDASPYWLRKAAVRMRLEQLISEDRVSLWGLRHLLAEVGHFDIRMTLAAYTHDPVTPFLRWFQASWTEIDASRIADAAGRALAVISRKRGGPRLTVSNVRIDARISELVRDAPYLGQLPAAGVISFPNIASTTGQGASAISPKDVDVALSLLADGFPTAASSTSDWPRLQRERFSAAVLMLDEAHGVTVSVIPGEDRADRVVLTPPRRLTDDAGLWLLLQDERAIVILTQMFDAWLTGLDFGVARNKIAASPVQWSQWLETVSELAGLAWEVSPQGRSMEARALPGREDGRLGLWPTLRWAMACAWLHSKLADPVADGELVPAT